MTLKHSINHRKVLTAAQTFPAKPIKTLAGKPPGGTQDVLARAIAVGGTRAELAQKIRDDSTQWARVIKAAGFVAS